MFRQLRKPIKVGEEARAASAPQIPPGGEAPAAEDGLSTRLEENLDRFRRVLGMNQDAIFREFTVGLTGARAALVYLDGMVNNDTVNNMALKAAMLESGGLGDGREGEEWPAAGRGGLEFLRRRLVAVGGAREEERFSALLQAVLAGDAVLLLQAAPAALVLSTRGFEARGVEEPAIEAVIRGPREGFTENLRVNTALLRRRLHDPDFRLVAFEAGGRTRTQCVLAYVHGLVKPELLAEVQQRLKSVQVDQVLEGGVLEQFIEESFLSPFPQVQYTERPDKVVAAVLEGRVAILVDGTPLALIVPATFPMFFQSPEDYYERWLIASFTRFLRIGASYVATFAPAVYVAIISFHSGLLPTRLALTISATRQGVPFPAVVEALVMELAFELLREAGNRLPQPIGQTVGIVGGIIIGDAAVSAGLVSPVIIVVVAMTAIASFSIPSYNLAIGFRLLRFPLLLAAGTLGLYGVALGFIIINIHMVSLKSFGAVYLSPLVPYRFRDWKDLLIRAPYQQLDTRPLMTGARQPRRQAEGGAPGKGAH